MPSQKRIAKLNAGTHRKQQPAKPISSLVLAANAAQKPRGLTGLEIIRARTQRLAQVTGKNTRSKYPPHRGKKQFNKDLIALERVA